MIDAALYWSLPGPSRFVADISQTIAQARLVIVNIPRVMVPGMRDAIARALDEAHVSSPVRIFVRENTDIDIDVAMNMGRTRLSAAQLAGFDSSGSRVVILQAQDPQGQAASEAYATEFARAVEHAHGNVRLVLAIHDESLRHPKDRQGPVRVVSYDGGLTLDEMQAYVNLRAIGRAGPGSTRLLRVLISEYAGFDVQLAESLMRQDDNTLMNVREALHLLAEEDAQRWRESSWLAGSLSDADSAPHVLHDHYLFKHGSSPRERAAAAKRIDQRYWRACARALLPWMEERRQGLIEPFIAQLQRIAKSNGGMIDVPAGKHLRATEPHALESNAIVGLHYANQLQATSAREQLALRACKATKQVRDDIAHLRAPASAMISQMVSQVDALMATETRRRS